MKYLGILFILVVVALFFSGCVSEGEQISSGDVKEGETVTSSSFFNDWKNIIDAVNGGKTVNCDYDVNGQTFTMIFSKYKYFMQFSGMYGTGKTDVQMEYKDNKITTYTWQETGSLIPEEYVSQYKALGIDIPAGKRIGAKGSAPSTEEEWKKNWDFNPDTNAGDSKSQFDMSWKCVVMTYAFTLPSDVYFLDQQEVQEKAAANMGNISG